MVYKAVVVDPDDREYWCEMTVEAKDPEAATTFLEEQNPGKAVIEVIEVE